MTYYVVLDEAADSQEDTCLLGIFTDEVRAQRICDDHERRFKAAYQGNWWSRRFIVRKAEALDTEYPIDYNADHPWGSYSFGGDSNGR